MKAKKMPAKLTLFTLVTSMICAVAFMRISSVSLTYADDIATGLFVGGEALFTRALSDPLSFDIQDEAIRSAGIIGFLIPVFLIGFSTFQTLRRSDESGKEHGAERFANASEMSSLLDKRRYANNIFFTHASGMMIKARNKRGERVLRARNHNVLTVGISGLGKTFNISKPELLQSVGDYLAPVRCSVFRFVEHIGRACGKTHAIKLAHKNISQGFDVVNTDPKGNNMRDTGWMYEAAGFKIKSLNTVDFRDSMHYNPYVNIKTRLTNLKNPETLECTFNADLGGNESACQHTITPDALFSVCGDTHLVSANIDITTVEETYEDIESADSSIREDLIELACRKNLLYHDGKGNVRRVVDYDGEKIASIVRAYSYKQSRAQITLTYQNTGWQEYSPCFSLVLDNALEIETIQYSGVADFDEVTGRISWQPGITLGRAKGTAPKDSKMYTLTIHAKCKLARVPDGVDLTKTVNCMVQNLQGDTDAPEGVDDQFWEDSKRLALMSYIALLFERYDSKYRNIPETMRLLNLAKINGDPTQISPLDVLMESWETGYIFEPATVDGQGDMRGKRCRHGTWVRSGNDPHDKEHSLALHCYHAYNSGAPETIQSVIVSCQSAFVNMFSSEVQDLMRYDEMELDTLGDPNQKQVIFAIVDDTDASYNFIFALLIYQAMTISCTKAYKEYGGHLPRHVRFILDEFTNIGKLPAFARLISVIRSRNVSVHLFVQSFSQLIKKYGKEDAETIQDCCSTLLFLGAQTTENLERIEKMLGQETIYAESYAHTFDNCGFTQTTNQNIQSFGRSLMTMAELRQLSSEKMLCFTYGKRPIFDEKYHTFSHPLYCYIDPQNKRRLTQPVCRFEDRFDFNEYRQRRSE